MKTSRKLSDWELRRRYRKVVRKKLQEEAKFGRIGGGEIRQVELSDEDILGLEGIINDRYIV
jgi:hypothetical protein